MSQGHRAVHHEGPGLVVMPRPGPWGTGAGPPLSLASCYRRREAGVQERRPCAAESGLELQPPDANPLAFPQGLGSCKCAFLCPDAMLSVVGLFRRNHTSDSPVVEAAALGRRPPRTVRELQCCARAHVYLGKKSLRPGPPATLETTFPQSVSTGLAPGAARWPPARWRSQDGWAGLLHQPGVCVQLWKQPSQPTPLIRG